MYYWSAYIKCAESVEEEVLQLQNKLCNLLDEIDANGVLNVKDYWEDSSGLSLDSLLGDCKGIKANHLGLFGALLMPEENWKKCMALADGGSISGAIYLDANNTFSEDNANTFALGFIAEDECIDFFSFIVNNVSLFESFVVEASN